VKTKKPTVLMLGWEFPPHLNGGLGVACYGLVKALSNYLQIHLVLPKSKGITPIENVSVIGMADLVPPTATLEKTINYQEIVEEVTFLPLEVGAYPSVATYISQKYKPASAKEVIEEIYNADDLYGFNVLEKVATYKELVAHLPQNYDLIHAHDWVTFPAALHLKQLTGKPLVLHVHSLETDRIGTEAKNDVYYIEREAMMRADIIVPVSHFTKECAIHYYGIPEHKFVPVHNAIDENTPVFRMNKRGKDKIVLFFGRITYQKGTDFMLETARKVLSKDQQVKFVVAGTGDKLDEVKQAVQRYGLADKFIFTGFLSKEQLGYVLAQTDVYLMTSISEPFGLAALEAAQFQVPLVITQQSGVAELLQHALKADFWDTDQLANYVYALLHYEGLRNELIEENKKELNSIKWDNSALSVIKIYESLM
jgi:glycosyltransferase involved in cell wall biosynthesis